MILTVEDFKKAFLPNIESAKNYEMFDMVLNDAQDQLEMDTQVLFEPTKIEDELHDYYLQDFRQTFWLQQLHQWPFISVDGAKIMYSDQVICEFKKEWLVVDGKMGTMELLPKAIGEGGLIFSMLMQGLSHFGILIYSGYERLPLFFHVEYTAGLDFEKLLDKEKADLRMAVGRRAAINVLPKLDVKMGISAESVSQDGVSESVSYTASAMYGQFSAQIEQYKKDDELWVQKFRRRHLKNIAMAIV